MNKHEGCYRGYILFSEAYYYETVKVTYESVDEVTFGFYHPDGGTSGEMTMVWHSLDSGKLIVPRLEAFEDSWDALSNMQDLIVELGKVDGKKINPKEFCSMLDNLGFKDRTERVSPYSR